MSKLASVNISEPRSISRFGLTEGAILRLWKAALKDDSALLDQIIEKVFRDMSSFDRGRAEDVISRVVNRDSNSLSILRALFADMRRLAEADNSFSDPGWQM